MDLIMDPPLYWRPGNKNDIGTSTSLEDAFEEKEIKSLTEMANLGKKQINKKTDKQIITSLSQEIAIKNQVIKGLETKLDEYEKRIRNLEVDLLKKGNIDYDTLLVPKIDIKNDMMLRKQDKILEQLKRLGVSDTKEIAQDEGNL